MPEDAEYVLFWYQRYTDERKELEDTDVNVDDETKVVCGQRFRHSRYEETPRREAGAQEDEKTNNNGIMRKLKMWKS